MDGYINLWRQLRENWTWKEKPFSAGQAWADLLMRAAWKKHTVTYQKQLIELRRGQHASSERQLAKDWGWSRNRVKSFLQRCQKSAMVTTTNGPGYIVITICNYNTYQVPTSQPGHERATGATTKGPGTLPRPGRVRATSGPGPGRVRATREEGESGEEREKSPLTPLGPNHASGGQDGPDFMLTPAYVAGLTPTAARTALELGREQGLKYPPDVETALNERAKAAGAEPTSQSETPERTG